MQKLSGGCHCRNILVKLQLARAAGAYRPRACDCDFCSKHGAAYVSDPHGSLIIQFKDERSVGRYRQGNALADLLLCRKCGVLIGALYDSGAGLYGAVNARVIDAGTKFGAQQTVSPQTLDAAAKAQRWQELWFPNVRIGS
jgi:hypothetical protein